MLDTQQTDDEWASETQRRGFEGIEQAYISSPAFFPPLFRLQRCAKDRIGRQTKAERGVVRSLPRQRDTQSSKPG